MDEPRQLLTPDLQAAPSEVPLGLSRAGVSGVQQAIRISHGGSEKLIAAEIDCTVDLDPAQKGVHMSRFPELFEEAIERGRDRRGAARRERSPSTSRAHIVERQSALRAEVRIVARYPLERRDAGDRPADAGDGLADRDRGRLGGAARAGSSASRRPGSTPARAPRGSSASARPSGSARRASTSCDVERILELVPLATHNQRGRGTLYVGTEAQVNAEQLVRIVEGSMSSPVYELLKRPDELFVVEHAHLQPRFVEDSVRIALARHARGATRSSTTTTSCSRGR